MGILGGAGVGKERLSMCAAGLKSAMERMGLYCISTVGDGWWLLNWVAGTDPQFYTDGIEELSSISFPC